MAMNTAPPTTAANATSRVTARACTDIQAHLASSRQASVPVGRAFLRPAGGNPVSCFSSCSRRPAAATKWVIDDENVITAVPYGRPPVPERSVAVPSRTADLRTYDGTRGWPRVTRRAIAEADAVAALRNRLLFCALTLHTAHRHDYNLVR